MLDEYETELVREILSEIAKLRHQTDETERVAKLALTLLRITHKEPEQTHETVDTIPVSHWI